MTLVSVKEEYDEEAGVDEDPAASGSETTTSLSIAGTRGSCSCDSRSLSLSAPAVLALVGVAFLRPPACGGRGEASRWSAKVALRRAYWW